MKDFFLKMLDSSNPTISSGIFLQLVTVLTVLYTWSIVSIWVHKIEDIPVGVYTFAGLVIAGKVAGMVAARPVVNTTTTVETATSSKSVTGDSEAKEKA